MAPDEYPGNQSPGNPFAIPGSEAPVVGVFDVGGCRLYAEVRTAASPPGRALLIIGAASDDAEMFRPIAERLAAVTRFTVVTYDPRGTRRSGRNGWPCDSARHADDAATLLHRLGLVPAAVFGASAGGIVALQLALLHPSLVRQVLVYEPGYFRLTEAGSALLTRGTDAARKHLVSHPQDWTGAMTRVATEAAPGLLDAPTGLEWYTERGAALAENFLRDDLPRTGESIPGEALAASDADIRFVFGADSAPAFREIAQELTRLRRRPGSDDPGEPDRIAGAGHVAYFTPEPVAGYIRRRLAG
ncbi:alpha/beta hydrolase [Cryobacterium adonitolivorans]|uniref:Alpha/beta hydrolase n=1 Tax=Cryobacterium adonitolivorans TaxID=1259189 RepID=A0A4R8W7D8_9MICO|nr:alpha/beta hydrolase [Cryobacterium adonitolivorans]TFC01103.1 alpha/beta hydrolase [Cryobacterium adonitolivorans]